MRRALLALLGGLGLAAWMLACTSPQSGHADVWPDPSHSASDIVRLQLEALRQASDHSIGVALRFASPGNRAVIGDATQFRGMLESRLYRPLLGHRAVVLGAEEPVDQHVAITVDVTAENGRQVRFVYLLRRQWSERCDACWLIDAVSPFDELLDPGLQV